MWECEWWCRFYERDESVKGHFQEKLPYRRPLSEERLKEGIVDGRLFGYGQCDNEVPKHLRDYFSKFLPIIKNTVVSRDDIGKMMKQYAEEENILIQHKKCSYQALF